MTDLLGMIRAIVAREVAARMATDLTGTVVDLTESNRPVVRVDGESTDVAYELMDNDITVNVGDRVLIHKIGGRYIVGHVLTL